MTFRTWNQKETSGNMRTVFILFLVVVPDMHTFEDEFDTEQGCYDALLASAIAASVEGRNIEGSYCDEFYVVSELPSDLIVE